MSVDELIEKHVSAENSNVAWNAAANKEIVRAAQIKPDKEKIGIYIIQMILGSALYIFALFLFILGW